MVFCCKIGFHPESVSDRAHNKSMVSISSTLILSVLQWEIVPHLPRELVGNLTSCHLIFSFKACFTKLLNAFFASIFRYRCYDRSRTFVVMCNADGYMFGEFTLIYFNTLPCLNCFFQRVWGVYKMVEEISKGWVGGGDFSGQKLEIPGRRGGLMRNSLRGGAMDIF